jgi:hypothetical protein
LKQRGLANIIKQDLEKGKKGGLEKIACKYGVTQEKEHPPQRCS